MQLIYIKYVFNAHCIEDDRFERRGVSVNILILGLFRKEMRGGEEESQVGTVFAIYRGRNEIEKKGCDRN